MGPNTDRKGHQNQGPNGHQNSEPPNVLSNGDKNTIQLLNQKIIYKENDKLNENESQVIMNLNTAKKKNYLECNGQNGYGDDKYFERTLRNGINTSHQFTNGFQEPLPNYIKLHDQNYTPILLNENQSTLPDEISGMRDYKTSSLSFSPCQNILPENTSIENTSTPTYSTQSTPFHASTSTKTKNHEAPAKKYLRPCYRIIFMTYFSYALLALFGYLREFLRSVGLERSRGTAEKNRPGYVPLFYNNFEGFCRRNMFRRIRDCWSKPIGSVPGARVTVLERSSPDYNWNLVLTGRKREALNMGSYNYMGFAENIGPCSKMVEESIRENSVSVGSTRNEIGSLKTHERLESAVAKYTGTESSIVVGMGFATNSTCIPAFVDSDCLVLSDEYNHSSIILGCRLSGATIRVFKHNDMIHLEKRLFEAIRYGKTVNKKRQSVSVRQTEDQKEPLEENNNRSKSSTKPSDSNLSILSVSIHQQSKTSRDTVHCPWKKILIIVEGIYSMEGTIINLPGVIRLKKKYKAYLYLDEAHSIGSVGPRGRGVIDYFGCNPKDVDIIMGTFTKSFGAAGGFVAGTKSLVDHLRRTSHSASYCTSIAAPIAQQVLSAIEVLSGIKQPGVGAARVAQLARNVRYFRRRLVRMGFIVYGSPDSPVVPMLIYLPSKVGAFVRMCEEEGVATVGVGTPATSLLEARARFCLSAAHDKELLDKVLQVVEMVGDRLGLKYLKGRIKKTQIEDVIY